MKRVLLLIFSLLVILIFILGFVWWTKRQSSSITSVTPIGKSERPLDVYTVDALGKRDYTASQIVLDEAVATSSGYIVYNFHFQSDGKKVSGLAHIPLTVKSSKLPVVVQLRGFVDPSIYQPGVGTKRSAEVYATDGFISLAPDFLGYGTSDTPSSDIFEERFQTYTTTLNLLRSLETLPIIDTNDVYLWGHSNGGHIGLTALEIYEEATKSSSFPKIKAATFWAPVSKPFPYSILYYTDESPDFGKSLRREIAKFENTYNSDLYSESMYLSRISVPLQLHQGTADAAVPDVWSDALANQLKSLGKDINYYKYAGADHNLAGAWNTVVARDIQFFRSHIK